MTDQNRSRPFIFMSWLIVLTMLGPNLALLLPGFFSPRLSGVGADAVLAQEPEPPAALLAGTIRLTPGAMAPDMVQITVGESVTFVNDDTQTRTLILLLEGDLPGYQLFLPTVFRGDHGPAAPAPAAAAEVTTLTITLRPGESESVVFPDAGTVDVTDADDPAVTAAILVVPEPLSREGPAVGRIVDYATKTPIQGAQVRALDTSFEATTNASGEFRLNLPPGDYTLALFAAGYTFANRTVTIRPFTPATVTTIELVPLDPTVSSIGAAGGTAVNSDENTDVEFAPGAVGSTIPVRLTQLPVDEFAADFNALPGPFTNGRIPLGFVMFEPDGTQFVDDAVWTIEYDGNLPVGAYVPCFYWIEEEARWGEPVDGEVVDLGDGQKGLRATLPHFSAYGFAAAPPPEPGPPQPSDGSDPPEIDDGDGPQDNPNESDHDQCIGSQINMASGELCQTIGTLPLPGLGGLPAQVTARYYSRDVNFMAEVEASFEPAPNSPEPDSAGWTYTVGDRRFTGGGSDVSVVWDGRNASGETMPPGRHMGVLTMRYGFDTTQAGGGSNSGGLVLPPVNCGADGCGQSIYTTEVEWPVSVVRDDLSPFGVGWFSPYDTLLVDGGDWATIISGNGRQLTFTHEGNGEYSPPPSEFGALVRNGDGSWTRTFRNGDVLTFNADGRLTRIEDRNGNYQQLLYESNGRTYAPGEWGLTTRIRRIVDTGGNRFDFSYDAEGWLETIADSAGRTYRLEHDAQGRLTAFVDPLGHRQTFTYDERNMMTGHTDHNGVVTGYVLDDRGRLTSRTWPTGTDLTVAYADDQVTVTTDRGTPIVTTLDENHSPVTQFNGVFTVRMAYDDDLRPTYSDSPNVIRLYDEEGRLIESITDARAVYERDAPFDQISRATTSTGLDTTFDYDARGNLTAITDALGQTYRITYDAHGQPLSITDPLGNTGSFQYDGRGLVTAVTDPLGRTWQMAYDAAGNLTAVTDPAGRTTTMSYDVLNRLTGLVDALNGSTGLAYDANGNLTEVVDPQGRRYAYAYNALNWLTEITYPDGGSEQYSYDANGNMVAHTDPRGVVSAWTYDAANRPVAADVQDGGTYLYEPDNLGQPLYITSTLPGGDSLATELAYIDGAAGYLLYERQTATGLPLTTTVDAAYGGLPYAGASGYRQPQGRPGSVQDYRDRNGLAWPDPPGALSCTETLPSVITETMTLDDADAVYCFGQGSSSTTQIASGVTVTVNPGVTLAGQGTALLEIFGALHLNGTAGNPALLTARSGAGSFSNYRIVVKDGGAITFQHAEMWYGAGEPQLRLEGDAQGLVENSFLGLGSSLKLLHVVDSASLQVHDSALADPDVLNTRGTLHVESTGVLSVTNSLLSQVGSQSNISTKGVRVSVRNAAGVLNGGNTFVPSEGDPSRVYLVTLSVPNHQIVADDVWKGLDESYGLEGLHMYFSGVTVGNGATLTVLGPQDIRAYYNWNAGDGTQSGHLRLLGTAEAPVEIYRWSPSFSGVRAYANGTLEAEYTGIRNGTSWGNVFVQGGEATLRHTILTGNASNGVYLDGGALTVEDSLMANNGEYGLRVGFGDASVANSAFVNNGEGGVHNNRPDLTTVEAAYNFWGAASGPAHASNPAGTGQAASNGVRFAPWLGTPFDGRLSALRVRSNDNTPQEERYVYDRLGRLTDLHAAGHAAYSAVYTYDAAGRLLERAPAASPTAGLPLTTNYSYDDAGYVTGIDIDGPDGPLWSQTYTYDDAGNVVALNSSRDGAIAYTYDALNRLTGVQGGGLDLTYAYDAAGNRTRAGGVTFSYDAAGRLASSSDGATYTYDAAGNLATKTANGQTTAYTWDGRGLLARIDYPDGAFSSYQYDDAGRRIARRLPDGTAVYYVYAGDLLVQELDENGDILASYTYDGLDRPLSMWRNGQTYFYVLDHLGSVMGLVDAAGDLVASYQYDPWGNHVATTGSVQNPLRFTGREFDEESGLYYLRFRYYDPAAGRFISRDPLGIQGGMNPYVYAHNNGLLWSDPYGLNPRLVFEILRRGVAAGPGRMTRLLHDRRLVTMPSEMRNMMRNLGGQARPPAEPAMIWTNADRSYAEQLARNAGRARCMDDAPLPYVSAQNTRGQEVAQIFFDRSKEGILGIERAAAAAGAVLPFLIPALAPPAPQDHIGQLQNGVMTAMFAAIEYAVSNGHLK